MVGQGVDECGVIMSDQSLKAKTIGDVIAKMDGREPLDRSERRVQWNQFYTDSKRREIPTMITSFTKKSRGYKTLFGGHSGNGKSTELSRFKEDPKISERFTLISFDVSDILNPDDLEIVELLLVIFLEVCENAKKNQMQINDDLSKRFEKMVGYFHKTLEISSESKKSFRTVLDIKPSMINRIKAEYDFRNTIRETYRPRLNELIILINDLLQVLTELFNSERTPMIIVDGLDRMSVKKARKLFVEDGQNIALIKNASMLLTIPISLIHTNDHGLIEGTIGPITVFKNLSLKTRKGQEDEETVRNKNILKDFVSRRMELSLIDPEALDLAIGYSGGVFRTLMDLISFAAVLAETFENKKITTEDMKESVKEAKTKKSRPLIRKHWEMLDEVKKNKGFRYSGLEEEARRELLQNLLILEYMNGGVWYDINPLLEDDLQSFREELKRMEQKSHQIEH